MFWLLKKNCSLHRHLSLGCLGSPLQCKSMGFFFTCYVFFFLHLPGENCESNWMVAGLNYTIRNSWPMNHHLSYRRSCNLYFIASQILPHLYKYSLSSLNDFKMWDLKTLHPCRKHARLISLCAAVSMQEVSNRSTIIQEQGLVYNLFASVISYSN